MASRLRSVRSMLSIELFRPCVARFAAFGLRLSWACMWEGTMSFLPEFLFYHLLSFCYNVLGQISVLSLGGDSSAALKFVQKVEVQMQVVGPLWELGKPWKGVSWYCRCFVFRSREKPTPDPSHCPAGRVAPMGFKGHVHTFTGLLFIIGLHPQWLLPDGRSPRRRNGQHYDIIGDA